MLQKLGLKENESIDHPGSIRLWREHKKRLKVEISILEKL